MTTGTGVCVDGRQTGWSLCVCRCEWPLVCGEMGDDLLTKSFFLINIHGQIESVHFPGEDYPGVYGKCLFQHGPDWAILGDEAEKAKEKVFVSQMATRCADHRQLYAWNLPMEVTFKSTNVFGWPQLVGKESVCQVNRN